MAALLFYLPHLLRSDGEIHVLPVVQKAGKNTLTRLPILLLRFGMSGWCSDGVGQRRRGYQGVLGGFFRLGLIVASASSNVTTTEKCFSKIKSPEIQA